MSGLFSRAMFPLAATVAGLGVVLAFGANLAQADPPSTTEYSTKVQGAFLGAETGTGIYGYKLVGSFGGESQGLTTLGGKKLVLQWNGGLATVGGLMANTHPYDPVVGVRAHAGGEVGWRVVPQLKLSPYLAAAFAADGHAITQPGVPFTKVNTVNNMDGLGGVAGNASVRAAVGGSVIDWTRSALLYVFAQEEFRSGQTSTPAHRFTEVGIHAKFDVANSLTASATALIGKTGEQKDVALGTSTTTTRWAIYGDLVKTLGKHWYVGLWGDLSRESNTTTTSGSAVVFDTVEPINATFGLKGGYH